MKAAHVGGLSEQLQPNGWGRTGSCSLSPNAFPEPQQRAAASKTADGPGGWVEPSSPGGIEGHAATASSVAPKGSPAPSELRPVARKRPQGAFRALPPQAIRKSTSRPGRVERGRRVRVRVSEERKTRLHLQLMEGRDR